MIRGVQIIEVPQYIYDPDVKKGVVITICICMCQYMYPTVNFNLLKRVRYNQLL